MGNESSTPGSGLILSLWRSVFRGPLKPQSDRDRRWIVLNYLLLHFRPIRVPARTLSWSHTFGLGGSCLVLIALLASTGMLMMFVYEPTPAAAYESIVSLQGEVVFGQLVRNVHHWSANLLVVVVLLHLLRVYFTGAFTGPRQFNWVIGLALLLGVLGSNFTGYLLPWDQLSFWAITISTAMLEYVPVIGNALKVLVRGGPEIGSSTLITFYTVHTTLVPVALILLMAFHFWRVRKAGGVVFPRIPEEPVEEKPESVLFLPNLLLREVAQAAVLVASVVVFAVAFNAPLAAAANPGMSPNPAKAPWYFCGLQELLLHFHPLLAIVVLPTALAAALFLIPYLVAGNDTAGVWFRSAAGRRSARSTALAAAVITPIWVLADEYLVDLARVLPGVPAILRDVMLPGALILAVVVGVYVLVKRRFAASAAEASQAVFVFLLVVLVVLTVACVWFRGPGMALAWPWKVV